MKLKDRIHSEDTANLNRFNYSELVAFLSTAQASFESRLVILQTATDNSKNNLLLKELITGIEISRQIASGLIDIREQKKTFDNRLVGRFYHDFVKDPKTLLRLPDFFIIGGARCGSSWLRWVLSQHPCVAMYHGEPKWFSIKFYDSPFSNLRKYLPLPKNFAHPSEFNRNIYEYCTVGEKSPDYHTMSEERLSVFRTLFPKARLILVVREPVDRLWSHLKHEYARRGGVAVTETSPADARRAELFTGFIEGKQGTSPADATGEIWNWIADTIHQGFFSESIQRWRRFYPAGQILLLRHEEMLANPRSALKRIFRLIGVPRVTDWSRFDGLDGQRNTTDPIPIPAFLQTYLDSVYEGETEKVDRLVPPQPEGPPSAESGPVSTLASANAQIS